MFWKKKRSDEKNNDIRYECVGVNYLDIIDIDSKNIDKEREDFLLQIKQLNRVYKKTEIDKIGEGLGYDAWESYIWIDINLYPTRKISTKIRYRWLGVKNDMPEIEEHTKLFSEHLNYRSFYSKVEIQDISQTVGASVFNRSNWQMFSKIDLTFPSADICYSYYEKARLNH